MRTLLTIVFCLSINLLFAQKPNFKKSFNHADKQTKVLITETEKGTRNDLVVPE
jgi:hypothetical protein